jgi:hypothetical protein
LSATAAAEEEHAFDDLSSWARTLFIAIDVYVILLHGTMTSLIKLLLLRLLASSPVVVVIVRADL